MWQVLRWISILILSFILILSVLFNRYVERLHLSYIPPGISVSKILHTESNINDTALYVYEMPISVARILDADGLTYLRSLPELSIEALRERGGRGVYTEWFETPVVGHEEWAISNACKLDPAGDQCAGYREFLRFYNVGTPNDEGMQQLLDRALFSEGTFYAFSSYGIVMLIPQEQRIVFAYGFAIRNWDPG